MVSLQHWVCEYFYASTNKRRRRHNVFWLSVVRPLTPILRVTRYLFNGRISTKLATKIHHGSAHSHDVEEWESHFTKRLRINNNNNNTRSSIACLTYMSRHALQINLS